jgi:hypothetical protein
VVIRASSAGTVRQLIAELTQTDPVRREAAIARLRVLGTRAVPALLDLLARESDPSSREAVLRVFEGLDEPRTADAALEALSDADADVRVAAIGVLRPRLLDETATRVFDALSSVAVDDTESPRVRVAAVDALRQLPEGIVQPIVDTAHVDPSAIALDEPSAIEDWLFAHADAPLSALHDCIVRVRQFEAGEGDPARRRRWQVARGAIHATLAKRGSRVALYDLRETFEQATAPLPIDYLSAAADVGDASLLDAMAGAWKAAPASEVWWRERVADAAIAIVTRLKLTRRHTAVRRLHTRWPGFLH